MEHTDQQEDSHPEEGGQAAQRVTVPVHRHQVVVVRRRCPSRGRRSGLKVGETETVRREGKGGIEMIR